MRHEGYWFLLLHVTAALSDQYDSCGTLLGDGRYCMDYSSRDLKYPPTGWNITTTLNLSNNAISRIDGNRFKDQLLLMKLDLSHNEIVSIDANALRNLQSLQEVKLGNNPYHCDSDTCQFRTWLLSNREKITDWEDIKCVSPTSYAGQLVINIPTKTLCDTENNTIHANGFEINTGTVFMIWIVVPILITLLTALYLVVNGNNRLGHVTRHLCTSCCRRVARWHPDQGVVAARAAQHVQMRGLARAPSGEDGNLAPVEYAQDEEDIEMVPATASWSTR